MLKEVIIAMNRVSKKGIFGVKINNLRAVTMARGYRRHYQNKAAWLCAGGVFIAIVQTYTTRVVGRNAVINTQGNFYSKLYLSYCLFTEYSCKIGDSQCTKRRLEYGYPMRPGFCLYKVKIYILQATFIVNQSTYNFSIVIHKKFLYYLS